MKRIVILTGSELRHAFFRKYIALSEHIQVVSSYCEGLHTENYRREGHQAKTFAG